ncbi:hypothetical protein N7536_000854 [Penicillium majusculum]|nr:hypothetical protein N7536_000854 [Penicillium majusculum]
MPLFELHELPRVLHEQPESLYLECDDAWIFEMVWEGLEGNVGEGHMSEKSSYPGSWVGPKGTDKKLALWALVDIALWRTELAHTVRSAM